MRKEYRNLTSMDEVKKIIESFEIKPNIIELELENAYGNTLAKDIISEIDVPPFNRASMDGYAVISSDTYKAREDKPIQLKLTGKIQAGEDSNIHIKKGEACEISTGAVMPSGADSVVMVEYTNIDENKLLIYRPVSINENITYAGSDIMVGERILKTGTLLRAGEIGVLAAIGKKNVNVFCLNVGIISTGNELVKVGDELGKGKLYDINSYSIASAVKECGATPILFGIVKDDENEMKKILMKATNECNIIITSGSTSSGSGDMIYKLVEDYGKVLVHGIDVKPGKPAIIGKIKDKPFFGLPGYSSSALTIFNEFVSPIIRKHTGKKHEKTKINAKLIKRIRLDGRSQLFHVGIVRGLAYPIEKGSGAITTLIEADGFIEIPNNIEMIESGEDVEVTLFGEPDIPKLLFVGSHCLGLDVISNLLDVKMRIINTGSTGGLNAIRNGIADISGIHLLDESGEYNVPFLKKFGIDDAVLVKGYLREQGLIVRPDSNIKTFEDILNVRIINRNTGSGTRVLTDLKIKEIALKKGIPFDELIEKIDGYHSEAKTHSAVASAVKLGKVDVGIGIRTVAKLNGLKFIKIADEEYDFVIPKKLFEKKEIKAFLEVLKSDEFKKKLPSGLILP